MSVPVEVPCKAFHECNQYRFEVVHNGKVFEIVITDDYLDTLSDPQFVHKLPVTAFVVPDFF